MLVIVHGGGAAVDDQLRRLGFPTARHDGLRLTPPDQMAQIAGVLSGIINKGIVAALNAWAGDRSPLAVGLCLGDGRVARTARLVRPDVDLGSVGYVITGPAGYQNGQLLNLLMLNNYLPVVASIGIGQDGELLNVNADDAAAGVAALLHARGLVLLTDVQGILDEYGTLIPRISPAEISRLIDRGVITGGMIPKATAAAKAAAVAMAPATIASWNQPEDLVRLARGESIGTQVIAG